MGCLYCGKDIGPFRLLRDDEFCSSVHRKRYGERLGRALDRIGAPDLVPSGIPGAWELWPMQEGHRKQTEGFWDFGHPEHPVQTGGFWPLTITPRLGTGSKPLAASEPVPRPQPAAWSNRPPQPLAIPVSLPVFRKSLRSGLPALVAAVAGRPQVGMAPREVRPAAGVLPLPVCAGTSAKPSSAVPICLPPFEKTLRSGLPALDAAVTGSLQGGIAPREGQLKAGVLLLPVGAGTSAKPKTVDRSCHPALPRFEGRMTSPAAEAAVRHVWPSSAAALRGGIAAVLPNLEGFAVREPQMAPSAKWQCPPAAEPVTMAIVPRFRLSPADIPRAESTAVVLPDLEHFYPIHDVPVDLGVVPGLPDLPEMVRTPVAGRDSALPRSGCPALAGPAPTPVQSLFSSAFVASPIAVMPDAPGLQLPIVGPVADLPPSLGRSGTPAAGRDSALPRSGCPTWPSPAESPIPAASAPSPIAVMPDAPGLQLPIVGPVADSHPSLGTSGTCPTLTVPAKPVRALSSFAPAPVPMRPPAMVLSLPRTGKPGTGSTTAQVGPAAGLAPSPVESLPAIAAFAPFRIARAPAMQLPQVALPKGTGLSAAGSGRSYPPFAAPEPRNPNAVDLQPISPLKANRLAVSADRPNPAIPQPGFIPIEFYCQRGLVSPRRRLTWNTPPIAPLWPRFAMRVAVDRTEDPAPWKPAPKTAARHEIPSLPEAAKRRARDRALGRFLKIAACLAMAVSLWFGVREVRIGGSPAIANREASGAPADATPADTLRAGRAPAEAGSKGPLAAVRHAIAHRAAYAVTDTLQSGMQSWGSPAKSWAPGWSRNPDGYVHPGELALFRPSLTYTDYRLEFFGQIESRSMGWVVRAHDKRNYYAMKFTVLEDGLRPVIAMAHYPVVDGKKGHRVEAPLSVMVHHNTPIHVAVDVQGNRVTASVEGQQVDSWTDDLLPAGGVGFFSEAGERARLYWMKVSKNQDWLGVVCSYLSGDSGGNSRETAEVWGLGIPAGIPAPAAPVQPQEVVLAEFESSSNDFSSPQRARIWIQRRIRPWSS